jgi:hypothetical protein
LFFKPKVWLKVGAFAVAGTVAPAAAEPAAQPAAGFEGTPAEAGSKGQSKPHSLMTAQFRGSGGEASRSGEGGQGGERGANIARRNGPVAKPKAAHHRGRKANATTRRSRGQGGEGGEQGGERGYDRRSQVQGGTSTAIVGAPGGARLVGADGEAGERGGASLRGSGGEGGEQGGYGAPNTQYLFGFTEGADTEPQGEKEIENDMIGRFSKRAGSYAALRNKTEFEYGVTDNLLFAFGTNVSYYRIKNVPDLDNRTAVAFDGLSTELKYRFLSRATAPFGLALSIEPEYSRYSETSGQRENRYSLELKLHADAELIPGRLYIAGNLLFEPEVVYANKLNVDTGQPFTSVERESTLGVSGAFAFGLTNRVFVGGEVRYLSQYQGNFLNKLEGRGVFVGPTLSVRLLPNALVQAAYSVQVAGKAQDEPDRSLDLVNFQRHQARLRFVYEF